MSDTFKAVTWNVGGQDPTVVRHHLSEQLHDNGVGLFLLQENVEGLDETLLDYLGLHTHRVGWLRVASAEEWVPVADDKYRLAPRSWTSGDGKRVLYADAAGCILSDHHGRTITALSFKLPPHIQFGSVLRQEIAVEALSRLDTIADQALTHGFLTGSDDNYDGDTGPHVPGLHRAITEGHVLRLHQPRQPTLGDREVDVFRTIRRTNGGKLAVRRPPWVAGPSSHKTHALHGQEFEWLV